MYLFTIKESMKHPKDDVSFFILLNFFMFCIWCVCVDKASDEQSLVQQKNHLLLGFDSIIQKFHLVFLRVFHLLKFKRWFPLC